MKEVTYGVRRRVVKWNIRIVLKQTVIWIGVQEGGWSFYDTYIKRRQIWYSNIKMNLEVVGCVLDR